jgi:hypothetical protein
VEGIVDETLASDFRGKLLCKLMCKVASWFKDWDRQLELAGATREPDSREKTNIEMDGKSIWYRSFRTEDVLGTASVWNDILMADVIESKI